jgi:hypothetical protein
LATVRISMKTPIDESSSAAVLLDKFVTRPTLDQRQRMSPYCRLGG